MTTMDNQIKEKEHDPKCPVLDGLLNRIRATPSHMPAGGWLIDTMTNETWRMTTIARRYRDRAMIIRMSALSS